MKTTKDYNDFETPLVRLHGSSEEALGFIAFVERGWLQKFHPVTFEPTQLLAECPDVRNVERRNPIATEKRNGILA
jgi:hypothetical protein